MQTIPSTNWLSSYTFEKKSELLSHLFEPCPTLADLLISNVMNRDYTNYTEFIESCRNFLNQFLQEEERKETSLAKVEKIIAAHPRLGPSKDSLSSHSSEEQKSLSGSREEAQKLADLNEIYESTFPGLRYVVFVAGRSRETIMENMRERIARGDIKKERFEAFNAMCDIALDRARKLGARL